MILERKPGKSPTQWIALGFILIILAGALLLSLPAASREGRLPLLDALFTATSATCVTGLVLHDTYTQFSLFGQIVILSLIQIGGLGFMTIATLFLMMAGRRIGLAERGILAETVSAYHVGGIVRLVRRILLWVGIFELSGAVLLFIRFAPQMGAATGAYYAIFHSISAFCNAGFDLMGSITPYTSLIPYRNDAIVNLTIMALIVIGGLGFVVWDDVIDNKLHFSRYRLHSKVVLVSSFALVIIGTGMFYLMEKNHSLTGMPVGEKLLASLFQSVAPRTAGFNTVDMGTLSEGGSVFTMLLMLIGASPGSTGGGLKTTTIVIILLSTVSYLKGSDDINVFGRRLDDDALKRAYCSATIYVMLVIAGIFLLIAAQGLPLKDISFEVISAIGTVGLSSGITRELNTLSRVIVMILMYSGRVGILTLFMTIAARLGVTQASALRNPQEKIILG